MKRLILMTILLTSLLGLQAAGSGVAAVEPQSSTPIQHLIVLMQQNHTFDNYFGTYPGAGGFPPDTCVPLNPLDPQNTECVEPYHIGRGPIADLDHSPGTFQIQFNSGRMDGFVYALDQHRQNGKIAMGYYDDRDIPYYWNLADDYVLFDRFFSSAFGGSIWNRMFWVAGVPGGEINSIPEGGFGDLPTIFDRLQERGISWKFYVNNYDPSLTYRTIEQSGLLDPQVQWVPLLSFDRFLEDPALFSRIVPMEQYFLDLENGELPAVAYMLALGATEHPLTSLEVGQRFTKGLIQALMQSDAWYSSAFLITYDDWGGWYDHVPPPQVDGYGYGFRVPALLVSPYARRGYVDSTQLDFTSILKFIEENWGLEPLGSRDARANSLISAFDFTSPPREPEIVPWERTADVRDSEQSRPRLEVVYIFYGAAVVLAEVIVALALWRGEPFANIGPQPKGLPGEAE